MNLKLKIRFLIKDLKFALKNRSYKTINNIILNIKYSRFSFKLFSKLNYKVLLSLIIIYILFVIIQLKIFSELWKPPDISDLPKIKNYLASYIYKHKYMAEKINQKIIKYRSISENFAKRVSVPFHLNWMFRIQQELDRFYAEYKDVKNFFIFNHYGRLVNYIPKENKFLNNVYTYTAYLKEVLPEIKKTKNSIIYYYIDSEYLTKLQIRKGYDRNYIYRGRFFNLEPFIHMSAFDDFKEKEHTYFKDIDELFTEEIQLIPYIMFFSPLYNQNFKITGAAGINIDINDIFSKMFLNNRNNYQSIIVNKEGYLIYALNNRHIGENLLKNKTLKKVITSRKDMIVIKKGEIYLKEKIGIHNWYVISKINPEIALFNYKHNPYYDITLYLFFLFELIVFFILFLLFNKYVTQPVNKLSNSLKHIVKGDSIERVYFKQNDEFKVIEDRYNLMIDKLSGYMIFGKTISQDVVEEYIDYNREINLNPKDTIATVLLIRIKNYEQLKKRYSTKEFNILMNKLLNEVELTVSKYKGYIDYFSADAILAVFGVPLERYNDAVNGYEAAKKIFKKIEMLNRLNKTRIKISLSLNTGEIHYSQMESNFGRILISLGTTIHETHIYDSIILPGVMAIGEDTYKKIGGRRRRINKVVTIKERDYNRTRKVFVKKL